MSARATKKATESAAYPAAMGLFEQLAAIFAAPCQDSNKKLQTGQLDALLEAFKQAPFDEVAAVSQVLQAISARMVKLYENLSTMNDVRERGPYKRSAENGKPIETGDSKVRGVMACAGEESAENKQTEEQKHDNATTMWKLRQESAAALQRRIDRKELLRPKEFQDALGISRQAINDAVKTRRIFAILGPAGDDYYPAFFADQGLNRREVEKVAKVLEGVPALSKYHFFTSESTYLGSVTPLDALKKGRLAEVLIAATAFEER